MRLLIAEDDIKIGQFLKQKLEKNFVIDWQKDGQEALFYATTQDYAMIILDVNLPNLNGFDICQKIRQRKIFTPIIYLSGQTDPQSIANGLNLGANDFLAKPFHFLELEARINTQLRLFSHHNHSQNIILSHHDISLNTLTHSTTFRDKKIPLNHKEYLLLKLLLINKNKVVKKISIWDQVWEKPFNLGSNVIEVHITNLRQKLQKICGENIIRTIPKTGYIID
jgi:two-component system, OmpR family, copper resistance phosphate regulon response regulator CusR